MDDPNFIVDKSSATGITDYQNNNGISNNPPDPPFEATNSTKLYKLNSTTSKTGLGITLKVMAGDKIDVFGKSYYFQNTSGLMLAQASAFASKRIQLSPFSLLMQNFFFSTIKTILFRRAQADAQCH